MTPKDNELRMQIGLVITHTDDELLFVRSEKNPNILDALQAFADLVRQDEREKLKAAYPQGAKVRPAEFIAAASVGVGADFVGTPMMWAEFPTRSEEVAK